MFVHPFPDTVLAQPNLELLKTAPVTPVYKVSVIIPGRRDLGAVHNPDREPQVGDTIVLKQEKFRIMDIVELMPPRKNFIYLQAACRPVAS